MRWHFSDLLITMDRDGKWMKKEKIVDSERKWENDDRLLDSFPFIFARFFVHSFWLFSSLLDFPLLPTVRLFFHHLSQPTTHFHIHIHMQRNQKSLWKHFAASLSWAFNRTQSHCDVVDGRPRTMKFMRAKSSIEIVFQLLMDFGKF